MTDKRKREPVKSDSAAPVEAPRKRPYDPPRVVSKNALEVIASACTPLDPGKENLGACSIIRS